MIVGLIDQGNPRGGAKQPRHLESGLRRYEVVHVSDYELEVMALKF